MANVTAPANTIIKTDANGAPAAATSNVDYLHPTGGTLANYKETLNTVTTTANITLDLANGNVQRITLDAARQITMPSSPGAVGQSFMVIINCAGFTPTWNSTPTIYWFNTASGTTAPTLNTTTAKSNVLTFVWENANSRWLGWLVGSEV